MASITFYGGVGTVTGSKYLIEHNGRQVLVDCGLFQGLKELRERNWQDPPFDPQRLDGVIITHAHIDHTGFLPRVVKLGFRGPVITSREGGAKVSAECKAVGNILPFIRYRYTVFNVNILFIVLVDREIGETP